MLKFLFPYHAPLSTAKIQRLQNVTFAFQLSTEWSQLEVIDLLNDGSGLGFGIIGGKSTGVVVKTILPGGIADRVSPVKVNGYFEEISLHSFTAIKIWT